MWVRVDVGYLRHPNTKRLAGLIERDRVAALGLLVAVWGYAAEHHWDGDLTDVVLDDLHEHIGWTSAGLSMDALTPVREDVRRVLADAGWAEFTSEGRILLTDGWDEQAKLIERRSKDAMRKQLERKKRRQDTTRTVAGTSAGHPHQRDVTGRKSPQTPRARAPHPEGVGEVSDRLVGRLTS